MGLIRTVVMLIDTYIQLVMLRLTVQSDKIWIYARCSADDGPKQQGVKLTCLAVQLWERDSAVDDLEPGLPAGLLAPGGIRYTVCIIVGSNGVVIPPVGACRGFRGRRTKHSGKTGSRSRLNLVTDCLG
jgi:hypothetical protein